MERLGKRKSTSLQHPCLAHTCSPKEDHGVDGHHAHLPDEDPGGLDLLVVDEVGALEGVCRVADGGRVHVDVPVGLRLELVVLRRRRPEQKKKVKKKYNTVEPA